MSHTVSSLARRLLKSWVRLPVPCANVTGSALMTRRAAQTETAQSKDDGSFADAEMRPFRGRQPVDPENANTPSIVDKRLGRMSEPSRGLSSAGSTMDYDRSSGDRDVEST